MRVHRLIPCSIWLLSLAIASGQTDPEAGLQDIRGPVHIPNPYLPWIIAGSVLLLGILGWWLWRVIQRKRAARAIPIPLTPYEIARRDLIALMAVIEEHSDVVFSSRVSGILRRYIEDHFNMPAPERTTEEFLPIAAEHPQIKGELDAILRDFLVQCDLVKFAQQPLDREERRELGQTAERFLEESYKRSQAAAPAPTPAATR